MSSRHLSRLAKAKGLDPLLGGGLNAELENSDEESDLEEEVGNVPFATGSTVVASAFALDSDGSSSDNEEEEDESDIEGIHDEESSASASKDTPVKPHGNNTPRDDAACGEDSDDDHYRPTSPQNSATLTASGEFVEDESNDNASLNDASLTPIALSKSPTHTDTKVTPAPTAPSTKGKVKEAEKDVDDNEYLDSVISDLAAAAAAGDESSMGHTGVSSPLAKLLRCDPRCLKLDQELRRKFGGGLENGGGGLPGGRARKPRRMGMMPRGMGNSQAASGLLARKRLVVSTPKEDWPKPPSFVGGGLGMKQCEPPPYLPPWQLRAHSGAAWFEFEMSSSLDQLQRKFQTVQGNHDPNLLAAFASRAPYHAEALLQLAMVFAHTGQMDRASEFVGRSLYVLESAFIEAFKPLDGACRLDAAVKVNKVYLAAMFRHMQMSGMVGGARTALEVGRLLLSVDPLGDPMGCLLALDSFALASRQGGFLLELHRSRLPVGFSPDRLSRLRAEGQRFGGMKDDPGVTVQDLPGLSLSACLAVLDSEGDVIAAREAMASVLLKFPVMLEPLLEKCGMSPRTTKHPQDWQSVMQHPHFRRATDRLPRGHVLLHLARIFALRGGEIWKHERAQELLYDGAGIALQSLIIAPGSKAAAGNTGESRQATSTVGTGVAFNDNDVFGPCALEKEVLERAYGKDSPIEKYLDLPSSDFEEAFALLPQEANLLHPRLMGANFMNERVRLRLPEVPRGWGDRGAFDELLAGMQVRDAGEEMGRRGGDGRWLRDPGGAARRVRAANLDPRAPLAQLFWQTLLPWNVFPTPSRPTPPPPDWL